MNSSSPAQDSIELLLKQQLQAIDSNIQKIATTRYLKVIGLWSCIPAVVALIGLGFAAGLHWLWYLLLAWSVLNALAIVYAKNIQLPKLKRLRDELCQQLMDLNFDE